MSLCVTECDLNVCVLSSAETSSCVILWWDSEMNPDWESQ